jgi:phosphate transport system substrate-binding protein
MAATPALIRLLGALALLLGALSLAACEQAAVATPATTTVTIAGATAMQPALHELTTAFSERHPSVAFVVRGGGSTVGEEQIQAGRVDLAASTLPRPPDAAPGEALVVPIGLDGIAVVVHAANQVPGLTLQQLHDIFSGRTLTWEEAGSENLQGDILLVSREDGSGTRQAFEDRVMGDTSVSLTAVVMPTSADVVDYIARTPNAIGYVSAAYVGDGLAEASSQPADAEDLAVDAEPTPGAAPAAPAVKAIPIDGELPTAEAIRSQRYPLVQPLYLISRARPAAWPRQFIDFVLSPAGQELVSHYHVPVR